MAVRNSWATALGSFLSMSVCLSMPATASVVSLAETAFRAALTSSALASPFLGALELRGKRMRRCW